METSLKPVTYSVEQVAELFKVDRQTVIRWIKDGKIKAFKLQGSRRWLFDEKYILEKLKSEQEGGEA